MDKPNVHTPCTVYICLCVNFTPVALQLGSCVYASKCKMGGYSQSKLVMDLYVYYVAGYSACIRSAPGLVTTTR